MLLIKLMQHEYFNKYLNSQNTGGDISTQLNALVRPELEYLGFFKRA